MRRFLAVILGLFLMLSVLAAPSCGVVSRGKMWIVNRAGKISKASDPRPTVTEPEETLTVYQDGAELEEGALPDFSRDIKKVKSSASSKTLVDCPLGYEVTFPADMSFDFSYSPDFLLARRDDDDRDGYGDFEVRISRDNSPYLDVKGWLQSLPNEFMTDEAYREPNRITVHEDSWRDIGGKNVRIFSATRESAVTSRWNWNSYTYAYIRTGAIGYFTLHFRSTSYEDYKQVTDDIIASLESFSPKGEPVYSLDLRPVLPDWTAETAALYEQIRTGDDIRWGFFTPNPFTPEGQKKIAEVEDKLDFRFPVIMWYRYIGHDFPLDGMLDAHKSGKLVEMTYQIGGDFYEHNPNFAVLDGDEAMLADIRNFARGAKEFGHPFLMRLNNEMNSTWVSYSGHLAMLDPDIFKENWITVYRIFQEEGVKNSIWVWNPNDVSFPPQKWNSHLAYYPGNEYVQMIGLTGYNTGNYFRDVTGERWRTFTEIYDRLWGMYKDLYADFPWIITEFASSSVGGDKKQWIDDMFSKLPRYKNIKIAVWWSYYDPDPREATYGTPARRYWLDEKPEYLQAFKAGLAKLRNQ